MVYLDTSFVAPLILPEATSEKIGKFIAALPVGQLAISHWSRVEFSSLLAREVRMGAFDARAAARADARFEDMIAESIVVLLPDADDFDLAKEYLRHHETGLRAGDALHLAVAKNNNAEAIYSLDKIFLKAGNALSLPVSGGIR